MHTVRISDEMKEVIERHVAAGSAVSDADFVEEAVRLYAEYLEDDEDELIAAAEEGIAAIERGDYTTISSPADAAAFWERVWADAQEIAAGLRTNTPSENDIGATSTKPG